MRSISRIVGIMIVGLMALAFSSEAQAYTSPYGAGVPVTAIVGYYSATNKTLLTYVRQSDEHCTSYTLGTPTANGAFVVDGTSAADTMVIVPTTFNWTFYCSNSGAYFTFSAPKQGTSGIQRIAVYGYAGEDNIYCSSGEDNGRANVCAGGIGDDYIYNYGAFTAVYGDSDNDKIFSYSPGGQWTYIDAGYGDDCVELHHTVNTWTCGPGTGDRSYSPPGPQCELTMSFAQGDTCWNY